VLISCPAVISPHYSVNEVIQKIVSQESTTENLIAVTRENQGKIEALNQLRKQIKTHCEDIKYSGTCYVLRAVDLWRICTGGALGVPVSFNCVHT
jgi:hypothetical protein